MPSNVTPSTRTWGGFLFLGVLAVALFWAVILLGPSSVGFTDVFQVFFGNGDVVVSDIVWQIRVPKACAALLTGISLAISGLVLQSVFKNPLAGRCACAACGIWWKFGRFSLRGVWRVRSRAACAFCVKVRRAFRFAFDRRSDARLLCRCNRLFFDCDELLGIASRLYDVGARFLFASRFGHRSDILFCDACGCSFVRLFCALSECGASRRFLCAVSGGECAGFSHGGPFWRKPSCGRGDRLLWSYQLYRPCVSAYRLWNFQDVEPSDPFAGVRTGRYGTSLDLWIDSWDSAFECDELFRCADCFVDLPAV